MYVTFAGCIVRAEANVEPAVIYIYHKGHIAGPAMKMPFIGPFLESVRPDMNKYIAKWNSGALSCVSVFHKCVLPLLKLLISLLTLSQIRRACL